MYRCQICSEVSPPGARAHYVTLEERAKSYAQRSHSQPPGARKDRAKRDRWRADHGGNGSEIIRQVVACKTCADAHSAPQRFMADGSPASIGEVVHEDAPLTETFEQVIEAVADAAPAESGEPLSA